MAIYKVGVVGGGAMGSGIAQLVAFKGNLPVVVKELNSELAQASLAKIHRTLDKLASKGKPGAENCKNLISVTDRWEDFQDVDLVIETVVENMEVKRKVFSEAISHIPNSAVMVSNTSALSIARIAEAVAVEARSRIAGLHFFNPPHQLKLVELIRAPETSETTLALLESFATSDLGRIVIKVKDCPGFLVNRLLAPYLNEAAWLLIETNLTAEEIDQTAQSVWPMGPFTLMDLLGIDVCAEAAKAMRDGYGERMESAPLTAKLVELKRLGNKTGAGFYGDTPIVEIVEKNFPYGRQTSLSAEEGFQKMMLALVNEAFLCLEEGIASADDIETGCREGLAFSPVIGGPLHWAESCGLQNVLTAITELEGLHASRFKPSKLLNDLAVSGKPIGLSI